MIRYDHRNQIRFASRLSARAVTGGILSTFALFLFFMSLCAAIGWWNVQPGVVQAVGPGSWISALVCWIASVFFGAYIAANASHSSLKRDGVLNGFVTWAGASSIGSVILYFAMSTPLPLPMSMQAFLPRGVLWVMFIGDAIAIVASILGGLSGSVSEARASIELVPGAPETGPEHRAAG